MSDTLSLPNCSQSATNPIRFDWKDLVMGLAEGVDPATNAPIVPLSASFCEAVDTLNANLCLCDASLEAASAGGAPFPEEGQSLVDNLGFVAMMCPDFDAEASAKDKGLCGGG